MYMIWFFLDPSFYFVVFFILDSDFKRQGAVDPQSAAVAVWWPRIFCQGIMRLGPAPPKNHWLVGGWLNHKNPEKNMRKSNCKNHVAQVLGVNIFETTTSRWESDLKTEGNWRSQKEPCEKQSPTPSNWEFHDCQGQNQHFNEEFLDEWHGLTEEFWLCSTKCLEDTTRWSVVKNDQQVRIQYFISFDIWCSPHLNPPIELWDVTTARYGTQMDGKSHTTTISTQKSHTPTPPSSPSDSHRNRGVQIESHLNSKLGFSNSQNAITSRIHVW